MTVWGGSILEEELGKGLSGSSDEVPPGLESYETLREYSYVFEGGQTNMFIVDATQRGAQNGTAPIRDLPILDAIDIMQVDKIDQVANTSTVSLVTILKSIHVDVVIGIWNCMIRACGRFYTKNAGTSRLTRCDRIAGHTQPQAERTWSTLLLILSLQKFAQC